MTVTVEYGCAEVDGAPVNRYTLINAGGLVLKVIDFGATVVELHVPDRAGQLCDVVLGYDDIGAYARGRAYFGATVGRVANRIAGAGFALDGKAYDLAANDGAHHLHGGIRGFSGVFWRATPLAGEGGPAVALEYTSPDGEERYPGTVVARVVYRLTDANSLRVEMEARASATTLINLAHHSYWNLGGSSERTIAEHELVLHSDAYTPGDPVPDGRVQPVDRTVFDLRNRRRLGAVLAAVGGEPPGLDHNFVVRGEPHDLRPVAELVHPPSGRVMRLHADQPGVQVYTGNFLNGSSGGKGRTHERHGALCLETQRFPNAVNVPGWRDQVIIRRGEVYQHTMVHAFGVT